MKSWILLVAVLSTVLGVCTPARPQSLEGWGRYLDRPRGPYRAQVIDADSKAPLVGAVVVALWRRDRVYPLHSETENYAVREVVTDSEGRFVLDVTDVERDAPRRTRKPEFLIFKPGYGAFPNSQKAPQGFTGGIFERSGVTVELPKLTDQDERRRHLREISPHTWSDEPFKELPELMRVVNEERTAIGLSTYGPAGKP